METSIPQAVLQHGIGVLRLPKSSGTHADVLAAVGLADLVATILQDSSVRLVDRADHYKVQLPRALATADVDRLLPSPAYDYLRVRAADKLPDKVGAWADYEVLREGARRYRELREQLDKARAAGHLPSSEELAQLQQMRPHPNWRRFQVLNTLQGDETSNKLYLHLARLDAQRFRTDVRRGLEAVATGKSSHLDWPVSLVQLFTPTAAKGYSRLKPDSTARGDKTKEQWADPFIEWLRYRGYFLATAPFFHGAKGEHIRLLCALPADISTGTYRAVVDELRQRPIGGGPPKLDALAVIELARLLIERSQNYHRPDTDPIAGLFLDASHPTPASVIAGVAITNYQAMGQAKAVWSLSTLALPGWFPVDSRPAADEWLTILDEHRAVVRGLKDDHSDEISLLLAYRRFLELRAEDGAWALLEFLEAYGPFVLRAREAGRKVRQLTIQHVRRVLVSIEPRFTAILDDPGFRAVAAAVRRATVSAQAQKSMKQPNYREIRYDLLPDLRRKRALPGSEPLMEAVADFISKYNQENARRRETLIHLPLNRRAPANVTTEQYRSFAALVERHGANTVGALLCAYGSCRDPREPEGAPDQPPDGETGEVEGGDEA
jgi:hypothetical protein